MKPDEIRATLVKAGYRVVRARGSHIRLEADGRMPVTLALHCKELPPGLKEDPGKRCETDRGRDERPKMSEGITWTRNS
jgi:predicted RNA binding protein YcfA (HicA-like mRNA interferase family)